MKMRPGIQTPAVRVWRLPGNDWGPGKPACARIGPTNPKPIMNPVSPSLRCSSLFLGLPCRILNMKTVKPKKQLQ